MKEFTWEENNQCTSDNQQQNGTEHCKYVKVRTEHSYTIKIWSNENDAIENLCF